MISRVTVVGVESLRDRGSENIGKKINAVSRSMKLSRNSDFVMIWDLGKSHESNRPFIPTKNARVVMAHKYKS